MNDQKEHSRTRGLHKEQPRRSGLALSWSDSRGSNRRIAPFLFCWSRCADVWVTLFLISFNLAERCAGRPCHIHGSLGKPASQHDAAPWYVRSRSRQQKQVMGSTFQATYTRVHLFLDVSFFDPFFPTLCLPCSAASRSPGPVVRIGPLSDRSSPRGGKQVPQGLGKYSRC